MIECRSQHMQLTHKHCFSFFLTENLFFLLQPGIVYMLIEKKTVNSFSKKAFAYRGNQPHFYFYVIAAGKERDEKARKVDNICLPFLAFFPSG